MFPDMKFQIDVKTDEVAMPALEVIQKIMLWIEFV
jgi:hypothetical protein